MAVEPESLWPGELADGEPEHNGEHDGEHDHSGAQEEEGLPLTSARPGLRCVGIDRRRGLARQLVLTLEHHRVPLDRVLFRHDTDSIPGS